MKTCEKCKHLWYFPGDLTQPYTEIACMKEHWDSISMEDISILSEPIECNDFVINEDIGTNQS